MKRLRVILLLLLFSGMLLLAGYFALEGISALRQNEGRRAFDNFFMSFPSGLLALVFAVKILKELRGDTEKKLERGNGG